MIESCEALVIGGGPAGASAALLLAQAGWSVVVLERQAFPRRKVCGEYLSATNWPLFERLGLAAAFDAQAGPNVRRVGLFAGRTALTADLPWPPSTQPRWGRALAREHFDSLLLARAAAAGARVLQPWRATQLTVDGEGFVCRAACESSPDEVEIQAPVVIAAHGSWEPGQLPTQSPRRRPRPDDLLGFKAHFRDCSLPDDLMPLLGFPGGYGGMVHTNDGRVSLSCCVRREVVEQLDRSRETGAGEAVENYILATTPAVRPLLDRAETVGKWLAAGPIRPGIRARYRDGVYCVGNAAGEAHPVVAEGISMALQSAWLLAERLIAERDSIDRRATRNAIAVDYSRTWRANFAPRLRAAAAIAHWAMRPAAVGASLPLVRRFPRILTWGARFSGKAKQVVAPV